MLVKIDYFIAYQTLSSISFDLKIYQKISRARAHLEIFFSCSSPIPDIQLVHL